jgi:hypothetical protein
MKSARGRQQKKWRRERLWKSRGVEKSKTDFPTPLGNPANPAGFPLSHSLGDCGRLTNNRTFHLLRKGDTSNVVRMGTFLMSVDMLRSRRLPIPLPASTLQVFQFIRWPSSRSFARGWGKA